MTTRGQHTLPVEERLKRKKIIAVLFDEGKSIRTPALVLVYKWLDLPENIPAQVLFTASKRNFKRAHDRNRIKRLMREAYRKLKADTCSTLLSSGRQAALMFIFTGKQLPDYPYVYGRTQELLRRFKEKINDQTDEHDQRNR